MKRSREPEEESFKTLPLNRGDNPEAAGSSQANIPAKKITELDESAVDDNPTTVMKCSLPPHKDPLSFETYGEYEAHYHKAHTNRCLECRKNFPSEHMLDLHIEECHDVFASLLREKGEHTYSCFVEGCDRKCGTPQKRRLHLIDKHMYPKNYFFAVTKEGIDGRNSLLLEGSHRRRMSSISQTSVPKTSSRRHSTHQPDVAMEAARPSTSQPGKSSEHQPEVAAEEQPDAEMSDLTSAMSALQFVPSSVRFGRGGGKAGFARK